VRQVGYLLELYRDARLPEYKNIEFYFWILELNDADAVCTNGGYAG
jgi:hypothetical protein